MVSVTLQQLGHESIPKHSLLPTELYQLCTFVEQTQQSAEWLAHLEALTNSNDNHRLPLRLHQTISEKSTANDLKQLRSAEHNRLVELRDKCDVMVGLVQKKLQLADRLCCFLVENSLRSFIPASKLFNGRSYQEYENEYMANFDIVCAASESADYVGVTLRQD